MNWTALIAEGPVLPEHLEWVGVVLIIIGGILLTALAVGLAVRVNAPEEVPHLHAHDEPPGASHHHGAAGDEMK